MLSTVARGGRESFQKRAREKARQEKQATKRAKRQSDEPQDGEPTPSRAEEDALMEEFAKLSARFETDQITSERYNEERRRIFNELGLDEEA